MIPLSVYIKKNIAVIGLEKEPTYKKRYNDNLCLFRCLALHRECDQNRLEAAVKTLYEAYAQDGVFMKQFAVVTMKDLYRVETTFQTNVCVYSLVKPDEEDERPTAELVRRSVCKYPTTLYLNLHETHFSFIQDVRMYCHSYRCRKCNSLWTHAWKLRQHESTCTGNVRRVFLGGVYHPTPSIFERLDDENIRVVESLRYYPYRATFDFECWFDTEQLPSDSDQVQWVARHVPLSVSVASNVPGHERVKCLVTMFLPRLSVHPRRGQFRQRETHGRTARRDPKDHCLPTSLRQGRRAVGMRVERDETRSTRKTVSGRCISPTSTRSVDDDVATDPERCACRNRVRHDRVRHSRAGRTARALCRDAARVQEHPSDTRGSRSVHASIRRRAQHHDDSEAHARVQLLRR